jgi:hypothetical protein
MEEKNKVRVYLTDRMVLAGFAFGIVYWLIDTFVYVMFSYQLNFFQRLLGPDLSGICTRLIVLCLFIVFGAHAQFTINERKLAEAELLKYHNEHKTLVDKRTTDLKNDNERLQREIAALKKEKGR